MLAGTYQDYRHEGFIFRQLRGWAAKIHAEVTEAISLLPVLVGRLALTKQVLQFGPRDTDDAFDRWQRQRIYFIAGPDHESLRYGKSERQTNREVRALAGDL